MLRHLLENQVSGRLVDNRDEEAWLGPLERNENTAALLVYAG